MMISDPNIKGNMLLKCSISVKVGMGFLMRILLFILFGLS